MLAGDRPRCRKIRLEIRNGNLAASVRIGLLWMDILNLFIESHPSLLILKALPSSAEGQQVKDVIAKKIIREAALITLINQTLWCERSVRLGVRQTPLNNRFHSAVSTDGSLQQAPQTQIVETFDNEFILLLIHSQLETQLAVLHTLNIDLGEPTHGLHLSTKASETGPGVATNSTALPSGKRQNSICVYY